MAERAAREAARQEKERQEKEKKIEEEKRKAEEEAQKKKEAMAKMAGAYGHGILAFQSCLTHSVLQVSSKMKIPIKWPKPTTQRSCY